MPVRFACPKCQSRLSVGRRKIGTQTECPRCGRLLTVPTEDDAAAGLVLAGIARSQTADPDTEDIPEFVVYDEIPNLVEPSPQSPPAVLSSGVPPLGTNAAEDTSPPPLARTSNAGPPTSRGRRARDSGTIRSVSRSVIILMALLTAVAAVGSFAAGYFVGRAGSSTAAVAAAEGPIDPVVVEGKLVFAASTGIVSGDSGAVIVALPVEKSPPTKIDAGGLRPRKPEPGVDSPQIIAIEQLGGSYLRADDEGSFSLVVPRPGRYYVLLVSHKTGRPTSQPADRDDVVKLAQYFARPTDLLGSRKYRLSELVLDGETVPISHNFGLASR